MGWAEIRDLATQSQVRESELRLQKEIKTGEVKLGAVGAVAGLNRRQDHFL